MSARTVIPNEPTRAADRGEHAVQMVMRWGNAVVAARDIENGKCVHIGEGRSGHPVDFTVPKDKLNVSRAPLLTARKPGEKGPRVVIVPGAKVVLERGSETLDESTLSDRGFLQMADEAGMPEGSRSLVLLESDVVCVHIDDITFELRGQSVADEPIGRVKWNQVRRLGSGTAISLFVHVGLVIAAVAFGQSSPYKDPDGTVSEDQAFLMQQYLLRADEKALEEQESEETADAEGDQKEGGTGARAKGEEGSTGAQNKPIVDNRYGVQGPSDTSDPHVARQTALREAAEFGMIGLMNSGTGGDPNAPTAPWGRDDSTQNDPLSARGNMWGDDIGGSFGGLGGVGEGGGGKGAGVGLGPVGTIGHGAGTGTGQGFGNGAGQGFGSGHGRLGGQHRSHVQVTGSPMVVYASPPTGSAPQPPPRASAAVRFEEADEKPIDPNGRFATTYRPGGGYLAAFESAVARGVIPQAEREVVSDIGARYVPDVPIPDGQAIGLRADLERTGLAPSGGSVHLRLSLKSADGSDLARPDLAVTLVLDVSGSMEGAAISNARTAAHKLVDRLAPTDRFSLVTFSSDAMVLVPIGPVGPRKGFIHAAIDGIRADGGTNISEGLRLGYEQTKNPQISADAVRCVMLLSDGHANAGIIGASALSRMALDAFQGGIQTSSFGLGEGYDGPLMSAIAGDGAGGYYYLRDSEQIASALALELDKRLEPVAGAVEVRVRLGDKIELLRVYGSKRLGAEEAERVRTQEVAVDVQAAKKDGIKRDRQSDIEGGMRFFMPSFSKGDSHVLLLKLRAPEGTQSRKLALVELKYKDRVSKKNVTVEVPVTVAYADSDAASAATTNSSVARTVQGFLAGEALMTAAARVGKGDMTGAAQLLEEREAILRTVAAQLAEPGFLRDADRLARLRTHAGGKSSVSEPLALAMLLETAGRSHLR
ncbi:MAG: VWA domain-containing protein [Polyangiaceae bacterium]|nr:VWA domain-containing protein [Polyangiaceae bacterium]